MIALANFKKKVLSEENIYLAYLRVKNYQLNEELLLPQEILDFETHLEERIEKIKNVLENFNYKFNNFDFITKLKKVSLNDEKKTVVKYRPLVRYRFYDLVIMQSVFNILFEELKNFLPKENLGVQLEEKNSIYLYKSWIKQYKEFVKRQRTNLSADSLYQYAYEYDIQQFYPSIQQEKLIKMIKEEINDSFLLNWVKKIVLYYTKDNISASTKEIYNNYAISTSYDNIQEDDLGLPQGPLFSLFLASFYTKDIFKVIKEKISTKFKTECDYFAYVDDGRIYFKDKVEEEDIKEIFKEYFENLNDNSNSKRILINEDKSCFLKIDDKSIVSKLNYYNSEVSLANLSIDPRFEIDEDLEDAIYQKHINMKNTLDEELTKLTNLKEKSNKLTNPRLNSDLSKLKKDFSTFNKRKATSLTKKISTDKQFYTLVDDIFSDIEIKLSVLS